MIVLNQDRIKTNYFIKDNLVFEIFTNKKLEELLQHLKDGEDITNLANINCYKVKNQPFEDNHSNKDVEYEFLKQNNETGIHSHQIPNYDMIFDEDYDDDYDDFIPDEKESIIKKRSNTLYKSFEQMSMGVRDTKLKFEAYPYTKEQFMDYLYDACGILPNFHELTVTEPNPENKKEMIERPATVSELKKKSESAAIYFNHEIADFYGREFPNILPDNTLENLSIPERNFVTDGILHPSKATDIIQYLKQHENNKVEKLINKSRVFHTALIDGDLDYNTQEDFFKKLQGPYGYYYDESENNIKAIMEKAETKFKEKNHGHAPMVLAEYMTGQLFKRGIGWHSDVSDEIIDDIVNKFNQKSVAKIAKYRNPVLFALSDEINFQEVKEEFIPWLACNYLEENLSLLRSNHFIEFYNKNKNSLTISNLKDILSGMEEHRDVSLNLDLSVNDMIDYLKNRKGYEESKHFENKYHYKFSDNDVAIKGRNIEVTDGDLKMYILPANDYRNFTVGHDTHCCQIWGNAGESCVYKLTTDPYAGVCVIERKGKILAQAFTWTDEGKDTIVFDNMEFADDRQVQQFSNIIANWASAMPYQNVHVGVGYNQGMRGWGKPIKDMVIMPTTIDNKYIYTDYHNNARSLKTNGVLQLPITKACQVVTKELVPSSFDKINELGLGYLLSTGYGVNQILDIADKVQNNTLTKDEMLDLFRASTNPEIVKYFDNIPDEIQDWIVANKPECIDYINNPNMSVLVYKIQKDPGQIKTIEHPSEELMLGVVKVNGLYLNSIKEPTPLVIEEAVKQNGFAIKFVPENLQTKEIQLLAVNSFPRAILSIPNPEDDVIIEALNKEPLIAQLLDNVSPEVQMFLAENHPDNIINIKNPIPEAVELAISKNGLLIRNFQNNYPEFRELAIRQNPYAIRSLRAVTLDECALAYSISPAVEKIIPREYRDTIIANVHIGERPQHLELNNDIEYDISEEDIELGL